MGSISHLPLMAFDGLSFNLCVEFVFDLSVVNKTAIGADGIERLSPPYLGN